MVDAVGGDNDLFNSIQVLRDEDEEFLDAIAKMVSFDVRALCVLLLCKL